MVLNVKSMNTVHHIARLKMEKNDYLNWCVCVCVCVCESLSRSPLGSSAHGVFPQARILGLGLLFCKQQRAFAEWVAVSFSRGSSQARD